MSLLIAVILITSEESSLSMFHEASGSISARVVLLFDGGDRSFWGRSDIGSMLIGGICWGVRAMDCMLTSPCLR